MMKKTSNRFLIGFFIAIALVLSSCTVPNTNSTSSDKIVGTWKSTSGDGFVITDSPAHFKYTTSYSGYEYEGDIVNSPDFTKGTGYLTIKITSSGTSAGYTVGNYTVAHWKNFNGTSCSESTAFLTNMASSQKTTQAAAESAFTVETGAFSYYGTYTKQ